MKQFCCTLLFFLATLTSYAQNFADFFQDKTLRVDYIFTGDANRQAIYLDELSQLPSWAGRQHHLSELPLAGNGQIIVKDVATGQCIYKTSFSSLFQEWLSTDEARTTAKGFENTFLLPFPKKTVEVEIKGLFDGHNSGGVSAAQELYENTLITDVHTAAKVYGNTEDTAVYQDATFFVKGDKNLDSVIKDLGKLDINWREYNLIKSSSNYPALQQSISGIYSISNKLFVGSLIFAGVVVSLLLFLWMNARKKEIAVLLSLGISKLEIFGQFLIEMVFISIPAYVGSYFLARYTAEKLGNNILNKVTGDIAKQIARQSASSQLGGGAEAEGFNKTLSSLDINVLPKFIIYVVIFMSLVLLVSLIISSFNILRRNPKELLIDNN